MTRQNILPVLLEIASEQGGYVTTAQARRLGVEPSRLSRLTATGDLRRVRHGVYAMRHAQHQLESEIAAWLAIDRERLPWERRDDAVAVLSNASAASMHGLGTVIPGNPELTVTRERRSATRAPDIELHVASLAPDDWMWLHFEGVKLPVTTPARTIVDLLLAGHEISYVKRAISEAIGDGRMTPDDLIATARRRKSRTTGLVRRLSDMLEPTS